MATRRANTIYQERLALSLEQASTTATAATKMWKVPTGRVFRVEGVFYNNPTGFAASDTNYYVLALKDGATTIASWSTKLTGGNGALTADTPINLALSATDANLVLQSGDTLSFSLTLTGTGTLPAGRLVVHGIFD